MLTVARILFYIDPNKEKIIFHILYVLMSLCDTELSLLQLKILYLWQSSITTLSLLAVAQLG
jgi:hypothetical protein